MMNGKSNGYVWKIVAASIVSAVVIGISGRTLHQVDVLEERTTKLTQDEEWVKLILTKMSDRMNTDKDKDH